MKLRTIIGSMFVASLSQFAIAGGPSLIIHNNTDYPSTTIANNGPCSSDPILNLPDGISPPHKTNVVSRSSLVGACISNKENCSARAFLNDNCADKAFAHVLFSINSGIKYAEAVPESKYCVKVNGPFEITMDLKGSPACQ